MSEPVCIIDLPSHVGTPATFRSRSHPTMAVCDRHAKQYAEAYDKDTRIDDWEPIRTELPVSNAWMQVHSGKPFYPLAAKPEDIDINDIAHALGMVCRYGGHCLRFYSVAEHSYLLSHTVDPEHALWALLHDASEAYIGDVVRPLKHELRSYLAAERRLEEVIAIKFNLPGQMPDQVKEHDTRIVVDEREQIMAPSRLPWSALEGYAPLGVTIEGWNPIAAGEMFLYRFNQLTENKENPHV